jgi:hypothetical protein
MIPSSLPTVTPCCLCGGPAATVLPGPPRIVTFGSCGLSGLAEFPTREERESAYQEEYYRENTGERFLGAFERMVSGFRKLQVRAVLRRVPGPGTVLDVGCGRGLLLAQFRERGW